MRQVIYSFHVKHRDTVNLPDTTTTTTTLVNNENIFWRYQRLSVLYFQEIIFSVFSYYSADLIKSRNPQIILSRMCLSQFCQMLFYFENPPYLVSCIGFWNTIDKFNALLIFQSSIKSKIFQLNAWTSLKYHQLIADLLPDRF